MTGERDDDFFDFSEQVLGEPNEEPREKEEKPEEKPVLNRDSEVHTSYLLVNTLLNLLVRKGIIYPHEVNAMVAELHAEYLKKKRGQGE